MRHTKLILLVLLAILLLPVWGYAQQTFQKAFYNNPLENFSVTKIIPTKDGGALVSANVGVGLGASPYLLKLNKDFEPEWKKHFFAGFEQFMSINDIIQVDDDTYVMTGELSSISDKQFFIYAIDADGNRKWGSSAGSGNRNERGDVIKFHQDKIYVAGRSQYTGALPNEYFVARFSLAGDFEKETFWVDQHDYDIVDMQVSQLDGIYVLGSIAAGPVSDPVIAWLNNDMEYQFEEKLDLPGLNSAEGLILKDNYILVYGTDNSNLDGRFYCASVPIGFAAGNYKVTYFDFGLDVNLADAVANQSDGIIFSGEINGTSKSCTNIRANFNETNNEFTLQWAFKYGDDDDQSFSSIAINSNNFILSAGYSLGYVANTFSIYVAKSFSTGFTGCREETLSINTLESNISHSRTTSVGGFNTLSASVALMFQLNDRDIKFQNACDQAPPHSDFGYTTPSCQDSCVTFTNNSTFADSLFWTFEGGTIVSYVGMSPPDICYKNPGTYNITLIAKNELGADTSTKSITIIPTPNVKAINDTIACQGYQIPLLASGADTYEWSGFNPDDEVLPNNRVIPSKTTTYYVKGTTLGCSAYDSVTLTLLYKPDKVGFDTTICEDSTITLSAENSGYSYWWITGSTSQKIVVKDSGLYGVTVSNACFAEPYVFNISIQNCNPTYYVPNAFSPNNDKLNDTFSIIGANITVVRFEIYSRWGELLFKGSDENNYTWDGTYDGKIAQRGQYIYFASIKTKQGKNIHIEGTVTLIR